LRLYRRATPDGNPRQLTSEAPGNPYGLAQAGDAALDRLRQDAVVPIRHYYRVTKYDPAQRDADGAYTGEGWTMFEQIGETFGGVRLTLASYLDLEARYLVAAAAFFEESGTSRVIAEGVEDVHQTFRVTEGAELSCVGAVEAVRQMLRGEGWCRLREDDRLYIHVGWDYYLYVGSEQTCERAVALAEEKGLFVDRDFPSPYLLG